MTIRAILREKGSAIFAVSPKSTLTEAAQEMMRHRCGALVVLHGRELQGIFTERDLLRVAATGQPLDNMRVEEAMTREVVAGRLDDDVADVMSLLTARRIRHLPIFEDGAIVGLISIGDVVKYRSDALQFENHVLKSYIAS
ncbi:MAG: CBS domain-containing protein [Planctomycetes bacterium]|nr:CBS domain-containing protein [Planctomycetota bacterium]